MGETEKTLNEVAEKIEITQASVYIKNEKFYLELYGEAETKTKICKFKITGFDTGIEFVNPCIDVSQSVEDRGVYFPPNKVVQRKLVLNGKQYPFDNFTLIEVESKYKEVTMADIEKKFGCKVKIVGE